MKLFFLRVWRCLMHTSSYHEVSKKTFWQAYGYLYFLLFTISVLSILSALIAFVLYLPALSTLVQKGMHDAEDWYPEELILTFSTGGELTTNVEEPYIVSSLDALYTHRTVDEPVSTTFSHALTIDTSASIDDFYDYDSEILLTKRSLVFFEKKGLRALLYSQGMENMDQPFVVDHALYLKVLTYVRGFAPYIPWIIGSVGIVALLILPWIMALFWSLWLLIYLVVFSLLSLLLSSIFKTTHSYGQLLILGMYVATIPIVLSMLLQLFGLSFQFAFSITFLIVMGLVLRNLSKLSQKRVPNRQK